MKNNDFLNDKNLTEQERYRYALSYLSTLQEDFTCCLECVSGYNDNPEWSKNWYKEKQEFGLCNKCYTKQVYEYLMQFAPTE